MRGRLFQGLEQRVERLLGEHVDFVDDINLELGGGRDVLDRLAQAADFIDAAVAGSVNFEHIERAAFGDFPATRVVVVESHCRSSGGVEALGKDARDGGLARAARPAKQVGVGDAVLLDGVGQGLGDVFLSHHLAEPLRAILPGYDLIGHRVQSNARVTTADTEQTAVAAFRPWRGS